MANTYCYRPDLQSDRAEIYKNMQLGRKEFWVVDVLGTEETSKSVKEISTTEEKQLTSHREIGKMLQKRQDHICEKFQVTTVKIHLKSFHLKRE